MKKFVGVFTIIASLVLISCSGNEGGVVEIGERMFATQVIHIYQNFDDYLGRTISLEGAFAELDFEESPDNIIRYNLVIRFLDDCCGAGGMIGFEVKWPQDSVHAFPAHNSWVRAAGVLAMSADSTLYLELSSLTVLDNRGMEIVRL
ncbi:MAG: hypothetical protein FWC65_00815 [Treponema sp.]|nr:hypothetical protein [Treponema sp.]